MKSNFLSKGCSDSMLWGNFFAIPLAMKLLVALFLSITSIAFAQQPASEPSPKPGEVNTAFSRVIIFVDKSGLVGHQHGVEGKLNRSQLYLTSGKIGTLNFDMTSFEADTSLARKYLKIEGEIDSKTREQVNTNMRGAEILNVNKYMTAKLDRISVVAKNSVGKSGNQEYLMKGEFTLCGRTRPIEISMEAAKQDGWYHLQGAFKILQSDYGIKPYSKMLGTIGVADQLVIHGDLWVVPE